jgi:hypothetical protein
MAGREGSAALMRRATAARRTPQSNFLFLPPRPLEERQAIYIDMFFWRRRCYLHFCAAAVAAGHLTLLGLCCSTDAVPNTRRADQPHCQG